MYYEQNQKALNQWAADHLGGSCPECIAAFGSIEPSITLVQWIKNNPFYAMKELTTKYGLSCMDCGGLVSAKNLEWYSHNANVRCYPCSTK